MAHQPQPTRGRLATGPNPVGVEYCVHLTDLGVFVEQAAEPVSLDGLDVGVDGIG